MSIKLFFPPSAGISAMSSPPLGIALLKSQVKGVDIDDLWVKTRNSNLHRKWSSEYLKDCLKKKKVSELEKYAFLVLGSSQIPQDTVGFSVLAESQLYPALALAWYLKRKGKQILFGGKLFSWVNGEKFISKYGFKVFSSSQTFLSYVGVSSSTVIPAPDFSGLPMSMYKTKIQGKEKLVLPFILLEGCNKNCAFCVEHTQMTGITKSMIQNFVREKVNQIMQLKRKYKTNLFFFSDCAINNFSPIFKPFLEELKRAKIQWGAFANAGGLDSNSARQMKLSGCRYLLIGCESGSQRVLDLMNKPHLVKCAENSIKNTKMAGIFNHCFFIVNFPKETKEDFKETLRFIKRNRKYIDDAYSQIFDLREGSYVSNNPKRFNVSIEGREGLFSQRYSSGNQGWKEVKMQGLLRHYQSEMQIATQIKLKRYILHPMRSFSSLLYSRFFLKGAFPLDRLFDYL